MTVSKSNPVGSSTRIERMAAMYAVRMSGVLTPGCKRRVSIAFCSFWVRTGRKSVLGSVKRKSSKAGADSGNSTKRKGPHLCCIALVLPTDDYIEELIYSDFRVSFVQKALQLSVEFIDAIGHGIHIVTVYSFQPRYHHRVQPLQTKQAKFSFGGN